MEQLHKRINNIRKSKNITFSELEELTSIHKSTLNRYLTGEIKEIPVNAAVKIANALEITLYELLGIDEPNVQVNSASTIEDSKEVDQLVIKCNGVFSKVFINGQEIEGLVGIKFSHKTEELAELELSTIVIPNGETLF